MLLVRLEQILREKLLEFRLLLLVVRQFGIKLCLFI